ncbi:GMP synthase [Nocardioides lentus]|uniref:GMP synthase n=1 Tax=Nocardioides lentus TaxID=338077 RepID=A0ABP5B3F1_9ACTN
MSDVAPSPRRPRVLVVQHQADCAPAWFGRWLAQAGCDLDVVEPWRSDPSSAALPDDLAGHDGLLVLGGSMGAHDDADVAWLGPVKALVRDAVARRVPTLGICLGHQLVAVALGGRVDRNPAGQTVGLTPVRWTPEAVADPLVGPLASPRRGVHWNDDVVVAEPPGAVALARGADGTLQVARFAETAWGVQLHPEADRAVVEEWAVGDAARHAERGLDQAAVLDEVGSAAAELRAAWEPLALAFAGRCRQPDRVG